MSSDIETAEASPTTAPPKRQCGRGYLADPALRQEVLDAICSNIRAGLPLHRAAEAAGIDRRTVFLWQARGRPPRGPQDRPYKDFVRAIKRAEAHLERQRLVELHKAAERNPASPAWLLSRHFPECWGRRPRAIAMLLHILAADTMRRLADEIGITSEEIAAARMAWDAVADVDADLSGDYDIDADEGDTATAR